MLDEFTSLGKLEIMQKALAFMAGYGVKAYIIVQDLSQLQEAYTRDESITSNCHVRIAYAPNKIETAKLLSEMTGKTTVVDKKTSVSGKRLVVIALFDQQSFFKISDSHNRITIHAVIKPSAVLFCDFNINCFDPLLGGVVNGHFHDSIFLWFYFYLLG